MKQYLQLSLIFLAACMNYSYGESKVEATTLEPFTVQGIEVTTTNAIEMNSGAPRIPKLWDSFYKNHYGKGLEGTPVYGVYTDYESDVNGKMSVIAGVKNDAGDKNYREIEIKAGKYLVFRKEGESPAIVVAAWQDIWEYFSTTNSEYERAYTTDFEVYDGPSEIAIYVAVK